MVNSIKKFASSIANRATAVGGRFEYWGLLKQAFDDYLEDRAIRMAASLAFYTMLSLAPLLVLAVKLIGKVYSEDAAREQIHNYLDDLMGKSPAKR